MWSAVRARRHLLAARAPSCKPIPVGGESGNFLARFTATGQLAVQQAAANNPQIGVGLAMGLAIGRIDLNGPIQANWMAGLVPLVLDLAVNLRIDGSATTEMHRDRETKCREKVRGEAQR
jgi:hypothetical protein